MTDIHSHVLPAIDDGARNIDASLSMLRQAYTPVSYTHLDVYKRQAEAIIRILPN